MTLGAKILAAAAILCLLLWGAFLAVGAQPLMRTGSLSVIYGEDEEFYADAAVFKKFRNETFFLINLPRARPAYRWWSVDTRNMTVSLIKGPHSVGSRKYLLRGDPQGAALGQKDFQGDWFWHFTEHGAAFSGNGFLCNVRRTVK